MNYPTLPFSSEWELPITTKTTTNSTQFGDSGIRQRERLAINHIKKSFSIKVTLNDISRVTTAEAFLNNNIGKPVKIPYTDKLGTSGDDGNLYRYKEIIQTFYSPSCSSFEIEVAQIRRLK